MRIQFHDMPVFKKLQLTFEWGRSLKDEYSIWPQAAANPSVDELYVLEANQLFVRAVCYQMYHELGHLILHANMVDFAKRINNKFYTKTNDECRRLRNIERQADDYALDCMLLTALDEEEMYVRGLGASIARLSDFFLLDVPDTRGFTHPDLDDRLTNVVKKVKVSDLRHQMNLELTVSIGLQLFFKITDTPIADCDLNEVAYEDFKSLIADLLKTLTDKKSKAFETQAREQ